MAKRETKRARLTRLVTEQKEWMREHGTNLAGYVANYSINDYDLGQAINIYDADRTRLAKLEKELNRLP